MPTRIVRKNASAPPAALAVMTTEPTYRGPSNFAKALVRQDSVISSGSSASDDDNREDITSSFHGSVRSSRKAAGYRSSILRDMSVRRVLRAADNDSDNDSITSANEQLIRLSANDIRASPVSPPPPPSFLFCHRYCFLTNSYSLRDCWDISSE